MKRPSPVTPDLTHITGWSNYVWLHYSNGHKLLRSYTMQKWHEKLPHFRRIGKALLVNPDHITGYGVEFEEVFINNKPFSVSRRAAQKLRKEHGSETTR